MFPLTRPYRQGLATLAVVVFTVLPTLSVVVTASRINHAGHAREVEVEIGRGVGLQVSLEAVRYPRPGEVHYRGIIVRQEEPRRRGLTEIARAKSVRLRRGDRELILETQGLRLRGESPRLALAQVGELLQRQFPAAVERISLTAPTCELDLGQDGFCYVLREVAGTLQTDRGAPTVRVSYRVASRGAGTRCELTLVRDRKSDPIQTKLVLQTMEGLPLPARVLDPFFDTDDWLGQGAGVEGTLALRQSGGREWEGEFQGKLVDLDLSTLMGRRFPSHRLSGTARVAIDSARWGERPGQGTGWVEVSGELTSGVGSMGLSLLRALESEMSFRVARARVEKLSANNADLDFRALGLKFAMSRDGEIRLRGGLGNEYAPDVVVATQTAPLVYAPTGAANVRGLIKALFPVTRSDSALMVPLTAESSILLSLPAPPDQIAKRIEGN